MGMVLMKVVVPGLLVVVDARPLMPRMVGLLPVPPAWDVVIIVVGLPSADVTSFRMVPAGSGPFVWDGKTSIYLTVYWQNVNLGRPFNVLTCILICI